MYEKGRRLVGYDEIEILAGERVQIRTGSAGDITDHVDEQCPVGKKWTIKVTIRIDEYDV